MSEVENASRTSVLPLSRSELHTVEHVLLDFSDVLYDDSQWRRWLLGLVTRLGLHTHYTAFFRVWDCEFQRDVWCGKREFLPALQDFLLSAGLTKAQTEEIAAATRAKLRAFGDHPRPFAGVLNSLKDLGTSRSRICVASRQPQTRPAMQARLKRLGLEPVIDDFFVSEEHCFVDDATLYLHTLAEELSCDLHRVAFVGRERDELAAAAACGMLTIAFNYDPDVEADFYIEQFDQLCGVISGPGDQGLLAAG